eukprot:7938566-Pyramimonas_sp.AAC.1
MAALRAHADGHPEWTTFDMLATGLPYPNFWKAPALVENLEAAAAGRPPPGPLAAFGRRRGPGGAGPRWPLSPPPS